MPKLFAIFIPLFTIIITTVLIVMIQNKKTGISQKRSKIWLLIGVIVFLLGVGLFLKIK